MSVSDFLFGKIFSHIFVYNILFEDSEVDCKYISLNNDSKVLTISGAGCGVAALTSYNPQSIDVVDSNLSHLALSAVKTLAPRYLTYDDFYQLLGYGESKNAKKMLEVIIQDSQIPEKLKRFWQKKYTIFQSGLYSRGLASQTMKTMTRMLNIDRPWLEEICNLVESERVERVQRDMCAKLDRIWIKALMVSPLQLLSQGVNFQQKKRIESTEKVLFHIYISSSLQNIARTDLKRNWFAWHALTGGFNHSDRLAIPPYLREDFYQKSAQSNTKINFHNQSLSNILNRQNHGYWTHINCSDILDWMDDKIQKTMMELLYQKASDGAVIIIRSVEKVDFVKKFSLQDKFRLLEDISKQASEEDRSCFYRHVGFYRVLK